MAKTDAKKDKKRISIKGKKINTGLQGFVDFIREQGIVGLAIGFVIGVQSKALIDQMSKSFIDPLLGLIVGSSGDGLSTKKLYLQINDRSASFAWGAFVYAIINFIIIALVIYLTFKWLRLNRLDKKKDK